MTRSARWKLLLGAAVTACVAIAAATANATTFNMTSETFDTSNVVNLTYAGPPAKTESVYATPVTLTGQINGVGAFIQQLVWCLDVADNAFAPYNYNMAQYNVGDVRPGMRTLDGSQTRQIASLMVNATNIGGTLLMAATQLAIWKVEYGADITFNGLGGTLLSTFQNLLIATAFAGSADCPNCVITVLSDAPIVPNQTFGFASVSEVPIPAAVWLFGSGLVGLGALARRRRQAAVA